MRTSPSVMLSVLTTEASLKCTWRKECIDLMQDPLKGFLDSIPFSFIEKAGAKLSCENADRRMGESETSLEDLCSRILGFEFSAGISYLSDSIEDGFLRSNVVVLPRKDRIQSTVTVLKNGVEFRSLRSIHWEKPGRDCDAEKSPVTFTIKLAAVPSPSGAILNPGEFKRLLLERLPTVAVSIMEESEKLPYGFVEISARNSYGFLVEVNCVQSSRLLEEVDDLTYWATSRSISVFWNQDIVIPGRSQAAAIWIAVFGFLFLVVLIVSDIVISCRRHRTTLLNASTLAR